LTENLADLNPLALIKPEVEAPVEHAAEVKPIWGFMELGVFHIVPRKPLELGGYFGPTPFTVRIPNGELREIIEQPETPNAE
jgi:hypothetical protein